MSFHAVIYLGLALAYFEGALKSFIDSNNHAALRDVIIGCFYVSIAALAVLERSTLPIDPSVTMLIA